MACSFITLLRRTKFIDFSEIRIIFRKNSCFRVFWDLVNSTSYQHQSLQLFSGSIHRRPMKLGMLVYHIIAQVQFFYFFEIRNIFRKIAFFRIFWDLVNFTAYRHQFITIYSYTIHLRSIKLGMLVYHIIAQNQIY